MGKSVGFVHDPEVAKQERLCFKCGAKGHMSGACPVEQKVRAGNSRSESESSAPGPKAKPKAKAKAEARKLQSESADNEPKGSGEGGQTAVTEALAEATKVLKSIPLASLQVEPRLRVLRTMHPGCSYGLIDGGASHPLRKAKQGEWESAEPISVKLAVGQSPSHLRMLLSGTLATKEDAQPIVPLIQLVHVLKCRVSWTTESCVVLHKSRGRLPVVLNNDCPELPTPLILELIAELEKLHLDELERNFGSGLLALESKGQVSILTLGSHTSMESFCGIRLDALPARWLCFLRQCVVVSADMPGLQVLHGQIQNIASITFLACV